MRERSSSPSHEKKGEEGTFLVFLRVLKGKKMERNSVQRLAEYA